MAQPPKKHKNTMYEERTEEIINPKDEKPTIRIARFLKPLLKNTNQVLEIPKNPFVYEVFSQKNIKKWPFNVHFTGWKQPHKEWEKWYNRLVHNHATDWLKAGILDGVHSSIHEVPCNKEIVLGVCEFWCSETNTFIFPWGEATITLEDVMILGGFPVLGSSVDKKIEGDLVKIEENLNMIRNEISRKRVVSHYNWTKEFMEEEEEGEIDNQEGEFEHVAFLSLWLSRFVFPDFDESIIKKFVFPIAAHLSKGIQFSLAPIVLANIYHDLTLLSKKAIDPCLKSEEKIKVSSLFKIVQLWVFERFPEFADNLAKPLSKGYPRVARWDNVKIKVDLAYVRSKLKVGEGFRWRPYADGLENWELLPFYEESEQVLDECEVLPCFDLPSFGWFCFSCVLTARNSKPKYQPHRVAMQFGYDQDLPGECGTSKSDYDQVGFIVPSKSFQPGMSRNYYEWWKDSMLSHEEEVCDALGVKRSEDCGKRLVGVQDCEEERPDLKDNDRSSDFPWRMQTPPVVVGPVMFDLEASAEHQLETKSSTPPLRTEMEGDETSVEAESSKTVVLTSPEMSNSHSGESHTSVIPHSFSLARQSSALYKGDPEDVTSDLDNVPLALRICSNKAIEKTGGSGNAAQQASNAPVSASQVTHQRSRASDIVNDISVLPSDFDELDHTPLAVRLQTIADSKRTHKPSESYASTGHVGISVNLMSSNQNEELTSPRSDADSQVTMKRSSSINVSGDNKEAKDNAGTGCSSKVTKGGLEARVAKLERAVAKLGAVDYD